MAQSDKPRWAKLVACALVASACFVPVRAPAQGIDGEKFQRFLMSDLHKALVGQALARFPPVVFRRCPTLVSKGSSVMPLGPISFNQNGVPNSGTWKQQYPVEGCGNDTTLNLYFIATEQRVNTVLGAPGTTRASLQLQADTLMYAHMGAGVKAKDCKTFEITNTRFEDFGSGPLKQPDPGPNARFRPWWETWTVVGCNRTFDVPITFAPNETGTNISQSSSSVVER
jgi:hypothetical protein